ncbi:Protein of unknown function DUF432 [Methanococcus vannielii SB]|uniref:DUF432 domain-containing protein n=1 Tax=Methanococcus vannielii (strain ATCC 35089 / DSM 1224 / JCM 13029 / OCM 148 / SB) TaxID=406327 RepID=A6USW0_METVS|nr:DUF432 domain-containing protein [Methanococcus vannielii]ABR55582.1 Protein of unknown function DUF432 [Methanococcus vannielii SB]
MFGYKPLMPEKFKVFDFEIEIEEYNNLIRYKRGKYSCLIKKSSYSLKIIPSPATGYGVHYMSIFFEEPVVVPPKDSFKGYCEAPFEVEVTIGTSHLDHFKVGKEKYCLYGTVDVGDISRYHKSPVYTEEPESYCNVKFILSNGSNEWKTFEKLVFPIWDTIMFYSENKAYYPTVVNMAKNGNVEMINTIKSPKSGLNGTKNVTPVSGFLRRI